MMSHNEIDFAQLLAAEKSAKDDWEQAVRAVTVANENVGRAHKKWLAAQKAVEDAKNQGAKPKVRVASAM
jgi:hypothetical protein